MGSPDPSFGVGLLLACGNWSLYEAFPQMLAFSGRMRYLTIHARALLVHRTSSRGRTKKRQLFAPSAEASQSRPVCNLTEYSSQRERSPTLRLTACFSPSDAMIAQL